MPASSASQQALMGQAYAYKKGEISESEVSDKVKEVADSMSLKQLKEYASTKHKGLPEKKGSLGHLDRHNLVSVAIAFEEAKRAKSGAAGANVESMASRADKAVRQVHQTQNKSLRQQVDDLAAKAMPPAAPEQSAQPDQTQDPGFQLGPQGVSSGTTTGGAGVGQTGMTPPK